MKAVSLAFLAIIASACSNSNSPSAGTKGYFTSSASLDAKCKVEKIVEERTGVVWAVAKLKDCKISNSSYSASVTAQAASALSVMQSQEKGGDLFRAQMQAAVDSNLDVDVRVGEYTVLTEIGEKKWNYATKVLVGDTKVCGYWDNCQATIGK